LGRYLRNSDRVRSTALAGRGWKRTDYRTSLTHESQDVAVALITINLEAFNFKKTKLDATASAVPALTDSGRLFDQNQSRLLP